MSILSTKSFEFFSMLCVLCWLLNCIGLHKYTLSELVWQLRISQLFSSLSFLILFALFVRFCYCSAFYVFALHRFISMFSFSASFNKFFALRLYRATFWICIIIFFLILLSLHIDLFLFIFIQYSLNILPCLDKNLRLHTLI